MKYFNSAGIQLKCMFENLIITKYIYSQFQPSSKFVRFVKIDVTAALLSFISQWSLPFVNIRTYANSRERISLVEFRTWSSDPESFCPRGRKRGRSSELLAHRVFQSALLEDRVTSNPTAKLGQHLLGDLRKRRNTRAAPSGGQEASASAEFHPTQERFESFPSPAIRQVPHRAERPSFILDNGEQKGWRLRNGAY